MKLLPRNRPLRYAFLAGFAVLGFVCVMGLMRWNIARESAARLQAICDNLDREDPGWRFDELLESRMAPAKEKNAYEIIAKVMTAPNVKRNDSDPNIESWRRLPEGMPPEVADWVGQYVADRPEAIALARSLIDYPDGLHPIKYSKNILGTLLPTVQDTRDIARLLQWDCRAASQLGDFDSAITDIRALRNAARSFGDEGMLIVYLVRVAILGVAVESVREMLSQGEPPIEGLALLQRELQEEIHRDYFARSLRWERAMSFTMMRFYGDQLNFSNLKLINGLSGGPGEEQSKYEALMMGLRYPPYREADQATMLERMTEVVEASRLEPPERLKRLRAMDAAYQERKVKGPSAKTLLSDLLAPSVHKVANADVRFRTNIECACAGIAAERFRRANQRWPNTLEELVPKYLERVPSDGFNGKAAIYRKLDDGIVIYSVGDDGNDDGGDLFGKRDVVNPRGEWNNERGKDIGIRLWDPAQRGK